LSCRISCWRSKPGFSQPQQKQKLHEHAIPSSQVSRVLEDLDALLSARSGEIPELMGDGAHEATTARMFCTGVQASSQHMWHCVTCACTGGKALCDMCAHSCHGGHYLQVADVVNAACACKPVGKCWL